MPRDAKPRGKTHTQDTLHAAFTRAFPTEPIENLDAEDLLKRLDKVYPLDRTGDDRLGDLLNELRAIRTKFEGGASDN